MASVFLCHASEDKQQVEAMQLALANAGVNVFYDQESLPAAGDYQARIRAAIKQCDVFVFVASPASIMPGRFTLTELKFARERWPSPVARVLSVTLGEVKAAELPQYLQAATILSISGNAAAEVRASVDSLLGELKRRRLRRYAIAAGLIAPAAIAIPAVGIGWPPWLPSNKWSHFTYETFFKGPTSWSGEFRRESNGQWLEFNREHQTSRRWNEGTSSTLGRIRLTDGNAIIEIAPKEKTIYYTDVGSPGYPLLKPIYRILDGA
ncbi:toll/interleukin-1 receptor domain-containing protein [Sphaerotilus uruguayifluvii]|uniref:TIR domain-containing protein n=1 Tax=Sphaerotilus uruguayifluvii TaxID=2735897 RepID=A0ABX2G736_9BURK|nr:toll/interleukin-1 receptor domain-containing protein [Leptothrix sp. C29]NRT57200.1 hypothetical protein [Leptothrix sp. C29]